MRLDDMKILSQESFQLKVPTGQRGKELRDNLLTAIQLLCYAGAAGPIPLPLENALLDHAQSRCPSSHSQVGAV